MTACSKISLACGYAQIWTFNYLQLLPLFGFLVWHQIDSSKTSTAKFLLKNISSCNQGSWILGSGCAPSRTLSLLEFQHCFKQVKTGLFIHRNSQASQLVVKESSRKWRLMPGIWKIHRSCLKAAIRFLQKKYKLLKMIPAPYLVLSHQLACVCVCVLWWKCCKL